MSRGRRGKNGQWGHVLDVRLAVRWPTPRSEGRKLEGTEPQWRFPYLGTGPGGREGGPGMVRAVPYHSSAWPARREGARGVKSGLHVFHPQVAGDRVGEGEKEAEGARSSHPLSPFVFSWATPPPRGEG